MVLTADGCSVRTLKATTVEMLEAELAERPPDVVLVRIQPVLGASDLLVDTVDQILAMVKGEQPLTPKRREELVQLFADHRSDRDNRFMPFESLSRSFVSIGTVRTQVKAILRKLGVNSQAAAVALAYRSGWPDSDPDLPVDLRLREL